VSRLTASRFALFSRLTRPDDHLLNTVTFHLYYRSLPDSSSREGQGPPSFFVFCEVRLMGHAAPRDGTFPAPRNVDRKQRRENYMTPAFRGSAEGRHARKI